MALRGLSHPLSSVCFESKILFSASQDLSIARSRYFKVLSEAESRGDVWSIKPPDFSLKMYRCLSVPRAKDRKACSDPSAPQPRERRRKTGARLPNVLHESNKRKDPSDFIVSYRPPDALESELMFVKSGKNPSGPYKNPKPHNFRPLDEALPDIVTTYEKDPGNLKLKSKYLDTYKCPTADSGVKETKARMDVRRPAEPR